MTNPFKQAAQRPVQQEKATGDVTLNSSRGWSRIVGESDDAAHDFEELVLEGFHKNSVVSACVRTITDAIIEADLVVEQPADEEGEWERVHDHTAADVIERPNPRDSQVEFIEQTVAHYLLGGNTLWLKRRNQLGQIQQLVPIRPDRAISAITDGLNMPQEYKIRFGPTSGAQTERIPAEDIVHIRDLSPLNDIFAAPRLRAAAQEIRTDNAANTYVANVLENHGAPSIAVGVETKGVQRKQLRKAEERWMQRFGPQQGGQGRVAFLPGARNIREIGFNLKELEFPDLRNVTREGICSVMGVDPLIVSIGTAAEGSSLSGQEYEEARKKLWQHTVIPILDRWESVLNTFLAPDFGGDIRFRFDTSEIEALKESRNDAIKRAKQMAETGVYSPQEIRAETGHDPMPENAGGVVTTTNLAINPVDTIDPDTETPAPGTTIPQPEEGVSEEEEEEEGEMGT